MVNANRLGRLSFDLEFGAECKMGSVRKLKHQIVDDQPDNVSMESVLSSTPKDALSVASQLPDNQRANLAQFCYQRVHLRELGLRIAATCDYQTLQHSFGRGAEVIYKQSRNLDDTLQALKKAPGQSSGNNIMLAGSSTNRS